MPIVARHLQDVTVVYGITHPILELTEKCVYYPELRHSMMPSRIRALKKLANDYDFFHAELDYAVDCLHAGVRYGVAVQGIDVVSSLFPKSIIGSLLRPGYKDAIQKAAYVVVATKNLLPWVRRVRADAFWVPSPVDLEMFKPERSPQRGIMRLFCPSRLDRWKGHEIIWKALVRLGRKDLEVLQVDWGWEPYYTHLKRTAPSFVRFVPLIPHRQTVKYYNEAHLTLGQMKLGSPGMAELEAAACLCPVTCYCTQESAPFLPNRSDPETLAALLWKLLDDADYRDEYTRKCHEYIREIHGATKVSKIWDDIWTLAARSAVAPKTSFRWIAYSILGEARHVMLKTLGEKYLKSIERQIGG
jgi:glycosyltransferase involved in cell wall biosynthesis